MAKKTSVKAQEPQNTGTLTNGNGETGQSTGAPNPTGASNREAVISNEEIAARAYEIYEREGRGEGRAMDHWLQAESELRAERERQGSQDSQGSRGGASPVRERQDQPRSARLHQEPVAT